jgi:hypothetical protein
MTMFSRRVCYFYINDIATLLQAYRPNIDAILHELSGYLSESDSVEVRNIVSEIQKRIKRFDQGPGK